VTFLSVIYKKESDNTRLWKVSGARRPVNYPKINLSTRAAATLASTPMPNATTTAHIT
jgi:hypothetical protein